MLEQLARDAGLLPGGPSKRAEPTRATTPRFTPESSRPPIEFQAPPTQAPPTREEQSTPPSASDFKLTNEELAPAAAPTDPEAGCPSSRCTPREAIPWRTLAPWDAWESFLHRIRDEHDMLPAVLGDVGLVGLREGTIELASPANSFARSQLRDNAELRTAFEHLAAEYFGEVMHIELLDATPSLPDAPSLTLVEEQRETRYRESMIADARHNPRIRSLLRTFDGQLETIEPLGGPALPPVGQRGLPL